MDEITTSQQIINFLLLMGGGFLVLYVLIYGVLWLAVAILSGLAQRADEDASFLDGDGMHLPGSAAFPSRHRLVYPFTIVWRRVCGLLRLGVLRLRDGVVPCVRGRADINTANVCLPPESVRDVEGSLTTAPSQWRTFGLAFTISVTSCNVFLQPNIGTMRVNE